MAFIRTVDVVTTNGNTYETAQEFHAEHGPLGTENTNYIIDSSVTLNEDKTGVRIVLTYVDEATWQSHRDAFVDEVATKSVTITEVSNETV
mgnify:CR=1 FL=1